MTTKEFMRLREGDFVNNYTSDDEVNVFKVYRKSKNSIWLMSGGGQVFRYNFNAPAEHFDTCGKPPVASLSVKSTTKAYSERGLKDLWRSNILTITATLVSALRAEREVELCDADEGEA